MAAFGVCNRGCSSTLDGVRIAERGNDAGAVTGVRAGVDAIR